MPWQGSELFNASTNALCKCDAKDGVIECACFLDDGALTTARFPTRLHGKSRVLLDPLHLFAAVTLDEDGSTFLWSLRDSTVLCQLPVASTRLLSLQGELLFGLEVQVSGSSEWVVVDGSSCGVRPASQRGVSVGDHEVILELDAAVTSIMYRVPKSRGTRLMLTVDAMMRHHAFLRVSSGDTFLVLATEAGAPSAATATATATPTPTPTAGETGATGATATVGDTGATANTAATTIQLVWVNVTDATAAVMTAQSQQVTVSTTASKLVCWSPVSECWMLSNEDTFVFRPDGTLHPETHTRRK
ncbi:hypothetical protein PTSG_13241 [Salpingoeca rosetta]|uniref:Uncharacterized protein n=1 Tax=Salpingoeca rosetta (strain ATCC 50818 / BSB-021) TaxID=946362 RepID=F2U6B6_SALR5|nr:uncharacterized protein PTSG_13241 [Salpingoeca rosetta]EGD83057.1 hypothetical protein PTSG_13241 [Salpingoeca rosetta]|eukprot:XP_004995421.1 hypothetical protein PTSG_13241 [Salpingoeca rosetta]